jgi:hypothetical protein
MASLSASYRRGYDMSKVWLTRYNPVTSSALPESPSCARAEGAGESDQQP